MRRHVEGQDEEGSDVLQGGNQNVFERLRRRIDLDK